MLRVEANPTKVSKSKLVDMGWKMDGHTNSHDQSWKGEKRGF